MQDRSTDDLIAEIDALIEQQAEFSSEKKKEVKKCLYCENIISFTARFCNHCGKNQYQICAFCKQENTGKARFCEYCGKDLLQKNSISPKKSKSIWFSFFNSFLNSKQHLVFFYAVFCFLACSYYLYHFIVYVTRLNPYAFFFHIFFPFFFFLFNFISCWIVIEQKKQSFKILGYAAFALFLFTLFRLVYSFSLIQEYFFYSSKSLNAGFFIWGELIFTLFCSFIFSRIFLKKKKE